MPGYVLRNGIFVNKLRNLILSSVMIAIIATFSACGEKGAKPGKSNENIQKKPVVLSALNGPTGMGMVKLMKDNDDGKSPIKYDVTLVSNPDELVGKIVNGEVDIAAVPANLAMVLYNRTNGAVQLAAVNTLGVLYLLENGNSINSIGDLKDKKVNVSGKGSMPEYVFQYLLAKNNLEIDKDVEVDFKLQHSDLAAGVAGGDVDIALLPQPHVTTAMIKNESIVMALDINEEWKKVTDNGELYMGAIIVNRDFAKNNKETLNAFLDQYKASVDFVNKNVESAGELIEKYKILPSKEIAKKAIPFSNIVYIDAKEAKASLNKMYEVLFSFDPKSVGGKLGDDQFYYER